VHRQDRTPASGKAAPHTASQSTPDEDGGDEEEDPPHDDVSAADEEADAGWLEDGSDDGPDVTLPEDDSAADEATHDDDPGDDDVAGADVGSELAPDVAPLAELEEAAPEVATPAELDTTAEDERPAADDTTAEDERTVPDDTTACDEADVATPPSARGYSRAPSAHSPSSQRLSVPQSLSTLQTRTHRLPCRTESSGHTMQATADGTTHPRRSHAPNRGEEPPAWPP
jgi:hypothetical protein